VGDGGADMSSGLESVWPAGKYDDDDDEYSVRGGLGTCTGLLDPDVGYRGSGISTYSTLGEQFRGGIWLGEFCDG